MPIIDETKKEQWLEQRRKFITGTDAAALLGISKWSSKLSVWLDKKGISAPTIENEAMFWGKKLERSILERYAEVQQCKLEFMDGYDLKTSECYPQLACSLDGWNHTLQCPVDAKNIRQSSNDWGEAGSDEIPNYYKTQLAVQMAITGAQMAHLAVLFSGQEFKIYIIHRDEELINKIVSEAEKFWNDFESDEMPQAGGNDTDTEFLKKHFSVADESEIEATEEIKNHAKSWMIVSEQIKILTEKKTEHENIIRQFMGTASIIPGICTYKNNKNSVKIDWEKVAKTFASHPNYSEAVANATETKFGARVLRIKIKN